MNCLHRRSSALPKNRGWGRRPTPAEAVCAFLSMAYCWLTGCFVELVSSLMNWPRRLNANPVMHFCWLMSFVRVFSREIVRCLCTKERSYTSMTQRVMVHHQAAFVRVGESDMKGITAPCCPLTFLTQSCTENHDPGRGTCLNGERERDDSCFVISL